MEEIAHKISTTLRTLRKSKAWSLDVTSQKTGVSKAMLGQIERGESSPTIATLWKIATGFQTSFSSFIDDSTLMPVEASHRKGIMTQIHPKDDKIQVIPIFAFDESLRFEVFIIELLPGCEHLSPPHELGVVEHTLVTEGQIEVLIEGQWRLVKKNEGLRFDAGRPHGYRNLSQRKATFHDMIHYP